MSEQRTEGRGRRNEKVGQVVSDKMNKTIVVKVFRRVQHNRYGKILRRSTVLKAHDETNQAKTGDIVRVFETRPLSKTKRWKLLEIVRKASDVQGLPSEGGNP
jgi:small subunit ribosomal protein S17